MSWPQRHPACFSVDLEDYYHPELIRRVIPPGSHPARVERSTAPLLDLLAARGVRATFFVVGEVIEQAPALIRRIVDAGHEVGCHTHTHVPLWEHSPESFRADLRRFKDALRSAVGDVPVYGFRAPTFSVDSSTSWALRVLVEEGFTYDSSIVPIKGPLYGLPGAPLEIYRPSIADMVSRDTRGPLVEFPAPVARFCGKMMPAGGGFYLRALPFSIYSRLARKVLAERPFFLYVHPWETDPGIPRFPLPGFSRWATYTGLETMLPKLDRLLKQIHFTTMREVLASAGFPCAG